MTFKYLNTQRKGLFSKGRARRAALASCSHHRPILALTLCLGSQKVMAGQTQPPASQICCPLQPQGWGDGQVLSRELKGGVPFPAPRMMTKHLPHAINAPGNPGQRMGTLEKVPVPTGPS